MLWHGLATHLARPDAKADVGELKERLLYRASIETVRCRADGILATVHEANVGSIFGIGFPAVHGGAIQYINGFEGKAGRGPAGFVARARELAAKYGERFEPPASLVAVAEAGGTFPA